MTVLIYVNTAKQVGDPEHIKVFCQRGRRGNWFEENDPEGAAFEYARGPGMNRIGRRIAYSGACWSTPTDAKARQNEPI
jgi:hypothetical protein